MEEKPLKTCPFFRELYPISTCLCDDEEAGGWIIKTMFCMVYVKHQKEMLAEFLEFFYQSYIIYQSYSFSANVAV